MTTLSRSGTPRPRAPLDAARAAPSRRRRLPSTAMSARSVRAQALEHREAAGARRAGSWRRRQLPDAQVSCQAMWEAYGPVFFPGSTRSAAPTASSAGRAKLLPVRRQHQGRPGPRHDVEGVLHNARVSRRRRRATCSERMVTINQKHLYHVLNPTGATVDIGSDIVVTNRSEYLPK